MFYAYLQCSVASVLPRGMGLSPGFLFFAALSASLHCGKTLGPEKSFEYGKVFEEYCWETRTFEEGKKKAPLIQGGGLRQAHTIEKVENPSSRLLIRGVTIRHPLIFKVPNLDSKLTDNEVFIVICAFFFDFPTFASRNACHFVSLPCRAGHKWSRVFEKSRNTCVSLRVTAVSCRSVGGVQ